jgi:hypothetical protein
MEQKLPTKRDHARLRGLVTTILLIALGVMIARDILVRRWGLATPPSPDVTRRSP